jgi:hypothetical protein
VKVVEGVAVIGDINVARQKHALSESNARARRQNRRSGDRCSGSNEKKRAGRISDRLEARTCTDIDLVADVDPMCADNSDRKLEHGPATEAMESA